MAGPGGGEHRAVVGDVRLTLTADVGAPRVVYAVRRRAARTPAEMAQLVADLTMARALIGRTPSGGDLPADDRHGPIPALLVTA